MPVAGRDVGVARQHLLAVARLADGNGRDRIHAPGERAAERFGNVLGDDDARTVQGHSDQHLLDRLGAAGGRADGDDALGGLERSRLALPLQDHVSRVFFPDRDRLDRRRRRGPPLLHPGAGRDPDLLPDFQGVAVEGVGQIDLGLGHEIDRAQLQRLQGDRRARFGQRRHHHHRHRPQPHQIAEEGQAVHARHFHVQGQHVGIELFDLFPRRVGIGRRTHHFDAGVLAENLGENLADQRGIVHDQHLDFVRHQPKSPNSSTSPPLLSSRRRSSR